MISVNAWDNRDKHVDESISSDQFLSSQTVIVYAAIDEGGTGEQSFSDFRPIGLIQGYSWSEQRQIDRIFEVGSSIPYLVPGQTMGQISLSRILLSGKDMLNAFFAPDNTDPNNWIKSLKEINKPINLLFAAYGNVNEADSDQAVYSRVFGGCWFSSRAESLAAGQSVIAENVSVIYEQILDVEVSVA